MTDIKNIVAKNLAQLRKERGLTQAELAQRFNYSDKAVSRWEHGDTLPDINVLYELCEFYSITMNDLVSQECKPEEINKQQEKRFMIYRIFLSAFAASIAWLIAAVWFAYSQVAYGSGYWLAFAWMIPISCIIVNYVCRNILGWIPRFVLTSVSIWSIIASMYLHVLLNSQANLWMIFLIGLPMEALAFLWGTMRKYKQTI